MLQPFLPSKVHLVVFFSLKHIKDITAQGNLDHKQDVIYFNSKPASKVSRIGSGTTPHCQFPLSVPTAFCDLLYYYLCTTNKWSHFMLFKRKEAVTERHQDDYNTSMPHLLMCWMHVAPPPSKHESPLSLYEEYNSETNILICQCIIS